MCGQTPIYPAADRSTFLRAARRRAIATMHKNTRQFRPDIFVFAADNRCVAARWSGERVRHKPPEHLAHSCAIACVPLRFARQPTNTRRFETTWASWARCSRSEQAVAAPGRGADSPNSRLDEPASYKRGRFLIGVRRGQTS